MHQQSITNEKILKVQADKRRAERVNSAFSGALSVEGEFVCHCVIKNVSNTGMRIQVPNKTELPDEFEVKTPAVPTHMRVVKRWNKGSHYGVTFIKEESEH